MSLSSTLLLGFLAGATILLGLPVGRLRKPAPSLRLLLNAAAVGVLLFLVWDVLSAAWEPIDVALGSFHEGDGGLASAFGYGALFVGGLAVGLVSLVFYESWMARQVRATPAGAPRHEGPGAMSLGEVSPPRGIASWSAARRLSLLIAVGIGLHNFAEGLAIGQSAASGEIGLAVMLVIGFGLHNATEGFGIVAPLAADVDHDGTTRRPSWGFLLALGAIGGGPTFIGTLIGHGFTNEPVSVAFLTLAAGSLIYVITQLIGVAARSKRSDLLAYGLLLGLVAGFLTDAIVTAAGV
ncbi:ZIP family zinc transporter [Nocardioides ginsengisegetis]|uniref:ZIP family zinc transporter n=1 Tax=Nocardioides ginsengisegetis TaxID=661491 RepID=A0A7W3IXQ3_9ACTN|nr:ZIP family zinc transporter [Nocardioides ginsengisegetis]